MNLLKREPSLINILIVEDHKILAESYDKLFAGVPHISIVGQAPSRKRALEILKEDKSIDLVLMDLTLGKNEDPEEPEGLKTCKEIKESDDILAKIIIVTSEVEGKWIYKAYKLMVEGYFPKEEKRGSVELLNAIDKVMNGGTYYENEVREELLDFQKQLKKLETEKFSLTKSEKDILIYLSKGFPAAEIARFRECAVGTVDIHKNNIFKKLRAANAAHAVSIAKDLGLIP